MTECIIISLKVLIMSIAVCAFSLNLQPRRFEGEMNIENARLAHVLIQIKQM